MPRNGSGVMSVPNSFTPQTTILSSEVNANFTDFATEMTNSLPRDGQAPMTGTLRLADGTEALPGLSFSGDTNTGFRRSASDVMEWVAGGSDRMFIDAAGKAWFLGALDVAGQVNMQAVAIAMGVLSRSADSTAEFSGQHYANDAVGAFLALSKSRNAAIGGHTIVQSGDVLGDIGFGGSDGTAFRRAADIEVVVDGTPGANDMPGAIVLRTTPDGASSGTERMAIRANGKIQIPNRSAPTIEIDPSGFIDLDEISAPANPAANVARLFCVDVGGTTRLAYLDSAGAQRVLDRAGEVIAIIEDQKSQNTAPQTLTAATDNVRELTTLAYNRDSLVSLSSNRFTLPAGTWEIEWWAPIRNNVDDTSLHQAFLYNQSDSAVVARGTAGALNSENSDATELSGGRAVVTIAASKAFEIRHRTTNNRPGGAVANFGTEVYTRVVVRRA